MTPTLHFVLDLLPDHSELVVGGQVLGNRMAGYPIATREMEEVLTRIDAEVHRHAELLCRLDKDRRDLGRRVEDGQVRGRQDDCRDYQIPPHCTLEIRIEEVERGEGRGKGQGEEQGVLLYPAGLDELSRC